jgi:GNAT superfamily N-acetyltransferase
MELRTLRAGDIDALSLWLVRAAADAGCDRWSSESALRSAAGAEHVFVAIEDGSRALVEYQIGVPKRGSAQVRFLAVEPDRRRLGTGGRAALALERRLARSVSRLYVLVPERMGLALYFWLRLGYRPLTQAEWPVGPTDGAAAWMLRELR